jgi:hypothetical protein
MSPLTPNLLHPCKLDPWVGLATLPVLIGLMAIHQTEHGLEKLGQLAESLFQGEQLPFLETPYPSSKEVE